MAYSSEAENEVCVCRDAYGYEVRSGGAVRLDISHGADWNDRQWELRALVFLSDNRRNRNHSSNSPNVPAFRYGETEFSYEGY